MKKLEDKKIGFILFEKFHGKRNIGSSRLRGHNIIRCWPEAESFKQSGKYDAVILQKVYFAEYAKHYKGVKILDICDADFLDAAPVIQTVINVDAITCPTEPLKEYYEQLTDKPVYVIPDRQDLDFHRFKKVHKGEAKSVVWFGYSGNSIVLEKTLLKLKKMKLKLGIIADQEYHAPAFLPDEQVINFKWDLETVNENMLKFDMALLPRDEKGNFKYKSNNKKTKAWALGLPVAEEPEDIDRFIDPDERRKEARKRITEVRENYDIKSSVDDFREIIKDIKKKKRL